MRHRAILAAIVSALVWGGPVPARAQTFDIAYGPLFGFQDPDSPTTPGWTIESTFDVDGQTFVVEGAWYRNTSVQEFPHFIEVLAEPGGWIDLREESVHHTNRTRYWKILAGIRSPRLPRRIRPYCQVAMGAGGNRFRTDIDWPESIDTEAENAACGGYIDDELVFPCENPPYPDFHEQRYTWFTIQPTLGIEADVWRWFGLRVAADLPILVSREFVGWQPQMTLRVVVRIGNWR